MGEKGSNYREKEKMTSQKASLKLKELKKLALLRASERYKDYYNVGDFFNGAYDTNDFVSPYTKKSCNVNSDIMVVAQDWSSFDKLNSKFQDEEIALNGYSANLPTNLNLKKLLNNHFKLEFGEIYSTNLFVFIKNGGMSRKIPRVDMIYSAKKYTLREIEIISPKLVICLGSEVFRVLSIILKGKASGIADAINEPIVFNDSLIVGAYHTGGLGTAAAGGFSKVSEHWSNLSNLYSKLK